MTATIRMAGQKLRSSLAPIEYRYHDVLVRRRLRRVLEDVEAVDLPSTSMLALALRATIADPTAAEAAITAPIERVRRDLLHSDARVEPWADARRTNRAPGPVRGMVRRMSKQPIWGRFLFHLIRSSKPDRALELGTAFGLSAAYQATALRENGRGRLLTLEGNPSLARIATGNLERLGLSAVVEVVEGSFADTLASVLERMGRVGYAFVDGHHDEDATVAYFQQIAARIEAPALLVFDDIRWSPGMRRAWATIESDGRVERAHDLGTIGICVVMP